MLMLFKKKAKDLCDLKRNQSILMLFKISLEVGVLFHKPAGSLIK